MVENTKYFGIATEASYEGLQYLTLFYSSVSMYLSYRIMQELKLRRMGLIIAFAIVAFHPTFIILSGSVNNDILSLTFMFGAILNTIVWYREQTLKNIMKIALCVGLGMFTKLSVWMVAPAIAIVFLIVLIKIEKIQKPYWTDACIWWRMYTTWTWLEHKKLSYA